MAVVITLLIAGLALMLLETVLPGLVAGIVGFGCLVAAVVMSYMEFGPDTGNIILIIVLACLVLGTIAWIKYFPGSPMARMFISTSVVGEIKAEKPELLHQEGVALTPLRPSGAAQINGVRVDVVTEGSMVPRGTPIKVVAIEGARVVVRALASQAGTANLKSTT